jgi:glutamine amidotransferase PdxT
LAAITWQFYDAIIDGEGTEMKRMALRYTMMMMMLSLMSQSHHVISSCSGWLMCEHFRYVLLTDVASFCGLVLHVTVNVIW